VEFGISLPSFGHLASPGAIAQVATRADELGYSTVWAAERLMVPVPPNQPWSRRDPTAFEPLVTLSHVAGITERIQLGTSVVILPVRNPVLLARAAASLDVLSGGRLVLGIGIGWMREEMEVSKVPFGKRGKIADEHIRIMRKVWRGKGHDGRFATVPENLFEPRPVGGSIPIWVGGNSDAGLRRVARLGDGWIPMGTFTPVELRAKVDRMRQTARGKGRSGDIGVLCNHPFDAESIGDVGECARVIESYASSGASQMVPRFDCDSVPEIIELMERFAADVMPSFR
jgi:probable F420-dependent oxidoreductase